MLEGISSFGLWWKSGNTTAGAASAGTSALSNTRGPPCAPAERTSISTRSPVPARGGRPGGSRPELVRAAVVERPRARSGVRRRRVVHPRGAEGVRVQLPWRAGVGRVDGRRPGEQVEVGGAGEARVRLQAVLLLRGVRRPERGQRRVAGLAPDELDGAGAE